MLFRPLVKENKALGTRLQPLLRVELNGAWWEKMAERNQEEREFSGALLSPRCFSPIFSYTIFGAAPLLTKQLEEAKQSEKWPQRKFSTHAVQK